MKSIYSIIHDNLKKALVLSLGSTAVVLVVFSYFSMDAVEKHASNFVMKHAANLAQAGINAQNIGDVDKEVARFAEAWKETQDLDVRIDIFIDEKLIAHAGQLQPFKILYTSVERNFNLPSGQTMTAQVQINLQEFVIIRLAELLVFEIFILLVYFLLVRRMRKAIAEITRPLELRVSWLKDVASKLPEICAEAQAFDSANISEIDDLSQSIESFINQIKNLESHIIKISFDRGRVEMAEKVAHNIRGSITALQVKIGSHSLLSASDKQELIECVNNVRDVSTNLLKAKQEENAAQNVSEFPTHLILPVQKAFEVKQAQYKQLGNVQLDFSEVKKLEGVFLKINSTELQSVVCNLVDNSIDAMTSQGGIIKLQVEVTNALIEIIVTDNGNGIPKEILTKIQSVGGSYGKTNGTGIGLTHAKEVMASCGGKIKIDSILGQGTVVTLLIPRTEKVVQTTNEIKLISGASIFVIDDDKFIHDIWQLKLKENGLDNFEIRSFFSPDEFNNWIELNGYGDFGSRQYFFDYDLKSKTVNGLDLIEQHGLSMESMLISGMASDNDVQARAKQLGVILMQKDFLGDAAILVVDSPKLTTQTAQAACEHI